MAESAFFSTLRVWAAMAWADGVIVPAEASAMKEFINLAPLEPGERTTAMSWLKERVELEGNEFGELNEQARANLYRSAARIAALDQKIAPEERAFLVTLRERLGIDEAGAHEIESTVFAQHRAIEEPED